MAMLPDKRLTLIKTAEKIGAGERIALKDDGTGTIAKPPDAGIGISVSSSAGGAMIVKKDGPYEP